MIFPVFILSISLLFTTELFAKERNQKRGIVLVAIGAADKNVMDWLKNDLRLGVLPKMQKQASIICTLPLAP